MTEEGQPPSSVAVQVDSNNAYFIGADVSFDETNFADFSHFEVDIGDQKCFKVNDAGDKTEVGTVSLETMTCRVDENGTEYLVRLWQAPHELINFN